MQLIRPGMGTENSLEVIASLIKISRPGLCLEIGAGDSSVAIANALIEAKKEHDKDVELLMSAHWSERGELLIPSQVMQQYEPRFISVDNFSAEGCSASEAWRKLDAYRINGLAVETINADFFDLPNAFFEKNRGIDFIWLDAGTLLDDVRFIGKLWGLLADGGILCLHEPYFTALTSDGDDKRLAMVRTPLWERIVCSRNADILSLPEKHKYRQSGLGIVRKRFPWESERADSFQQEMINVGEAPIKFSVTGLEVPPQKAPVSLLKQYEARMVLHAIAMGMSTIKAIREVVKIEERQLLKLLIKLQDAGAISALDGEYHEDASFWDRIDSTHFPVARHADMTDRQLEKPEILDLIVGHLSRDREYEESYISKYCACFTEDFARLRRKLVEEGRLVKCGSKYKVS